MVDCEVRHLPSCGVRQIPSVAQPSQARQVQSSECEVGEGKAHLSGTSLAIEAVRRTIRILDKNDKYMTKSVPGPRSMIVRNVEDESKMRMAKLDDF